MYILIMVAPSGTMTASRTTNYMQAEEVDLPPGWMAFVIEPLSMQAKHNHGFETPNGLINGRG